MVLDTPRFARCAARLIVPALLCLPVPALAQADAPDLYARVGKRMEADPALAERLGKPAPEMALLDWVVGSWDVAVDVEANPGRPTEYGSSVVTPLFSGTWLEFRDTYPTGTQDLGYIGYNVAERRWVSISIDNLGNANIAASKGGWQGDRIVFEGDFLVLGEKAHLRQTLVRSSLDAYRLENDELMPDGSWRRLDAYRYTRRKPGPAAGG